MHDRPISIAMSESAIRDNGGKGWGPATRRHGHVDAGHRAAEIERTLSAKLLHYLILSGDSKPMEQPSFFQAIFGSAAVYFYWVVWIFTNIACTYFVYQSAIRRTSPALNIGAYWWAVFTLLGGIWTLFIYWLMEHSSLSRNNEVLRP